MNKMMRSEHNHEKEYVVTVDKPVTDEFMQAMSQGVEILDVITKPCKVYRQSEDVFRIILTQGLNLQIRRMCKALGYRVLKLERVRIMNITLDQLERGVEAFEGNGTTSAPVHVELGEGVTNIKAIFQLCPRRPSENTAKVYVKPWYRVKFMKNGSACCKTCYRYASK